MGLVWNREVLELGNRTLTIPQKNAWHIFGLFRVELRGKLDEFSGRELGKFLLQWSKNALRRMESLKFPRQRPYGRTDI